MWITATAMFAAVVVVVTVKILVDTDTWVKWTFIWAFLSVLLWFLWSIALSAVVAISANDFGVSHRLYGTLQCWLFILLSVAVCNGSEISIKYIKRFYTRSVRGVYIVQEVEKLGIVVKRLTSQVVSEFIPSSRPKAWKRIREKLAMRLGFSEFMATPTADGMSWTEFIRRSLLRGHPRGRVVPRVATKEPSDSENGISAIDVGDTNPDNGMSKRNSESKQEDTIVTVKDA
eukprot:45564_1